ncbi:TPA: recombinase family protein [Morganella morganii]
MPKLYSYVRWSTDKQAKGSTLERQLTSAKEFAREHKLELVEIIDPGVSAFRGKNSEKGCGKLGDFIDAARQGVIEADCWLYVENLDRLTRQEITTAQKLFIELLELGLTLVTGMDKRIYTLESVNKNPSELMMSIMLFSRANEESKTKQNRTIGNVKTLISRHKNGSPVNIKSCGKHPFWIDDTGPQYETVKCHPVYWEIAREAIELFLSGHGTYKVKRHLDEKYPLGLNGKEWDYQVIKRMRENRALIGERKINIQGKKYILENYYPKLCKDENEFILLQELKKQNNHKSKKDPTKENIKLLSGLAILKCSRCGGPMSSFISKGKSRYICLNGRHLQKGCIGWSVAAPLIEHCVIIALLMGKIDTNHNEEKDTTRLVEVIDKYEIKISELSKSISNIVYALEKTNDINELTDRLNTLAGQREKLLKELSQLNERKSILDNQGSFEFNMTEFIKKIPWSVFVNVKHGNRNEIRSAINNIIEQVIIEKKDGCIAIKVKCYNSPLQFIFSGDKRKPLWKFNAELYPEKEIDDIELGPNELKFMRSDLIKEANRQLNIMLESYHVIFVKACQMLALVGYPEIDGTAFWPNR